MVKDTDTCLIGQPQDGQEWTSTIHKDWLLAVIGVRAYYRPFFSQVIGVSLARCRHEKKGGEMPVKDVLDKFWRTRNGPVVLATVSAQGLPNAAYCEAVNVYGEDKIVIADHGFEYTRQNILAGSKGAILFSTNDGKSHQVKGAIEYQTEGPIYDDMKKWLYPRFAGHAAITLTVEEIHSGTKKLYG